LLVTPASGPQAPLLFEMTICHLFICFVDFRKAYDMVRRDLLMECLAGMGLHERMLSAICAMYWKPTLAVKIGNSLSQPFESTRGVKQGDPLSPLLFGVFFDRIEKWFSEKLPGVGVELGGNFYKCCYMQMTLLSWLTPNTSCKTC